jgi:hypothetical protein
MINKPNDAKFVDLLNDEMSAIRYCQELGLLKREMQCCGQNLEIKQPVKEKTEEFIGVVKKMCRKEVGVRKGCFF